MAERRIIELSLYFFCAVDYCQCFGIFILCFASFIENHVHRNHFDCSFQIVSFIAVVGFNLRLGGCCWKTIRCFQKIFGFLFSCLFKELRSFKIVFIVLSSLFAGFVHFIILFMVFIEIKVFFRLYWIEKYHFGILVDECSQIQLFHFEIIGFAKLRN